MKALEKAAQDREATPAVAPQAGRELSLEALTPKSGAMGTDNDTRPPVGVKSSANPAGFSAGLSKSAVRPDRSHTDAQRHAATVLSARQTRNPGAVEWMRGHPLYVFGGLAGMFLLAYGSYVYIQIAHPALLLTTPPRAPTTAVAPAPVTTAPTPAAPPVDGETNQPAIAATQGAETANSQFGAMPSVFANRTESQPAQTSPDSAKNISSDPATQSKPPVSALPPTRSAGTSSPMAVAPQIIAPQNRVAVSRGDATVPRVNPAVAEAYAALEGGQYDAAQRLYSQVLRSEPANVDALMGLAALAQKDNRAAEAQRYFLAILDVEPRNALAQSGLIALMGQSDPQAAESRLKQLLAREPSPPLFFNLGNLYAEQGLWSQAQQAYFQAHNLEPRNPDYAYNLAVGLEHLGQQKLALGFYRKAQQLASARGAANFDPARLQDRITQLSSRFE